MSDDTINPIDLITRTAQILTRQALDAGEDARCLAQSVIDETNGVSFLGFNETALLRISYQAIRQVAMAATSQNVAMLRDAANMLEDVYQTKIGKDD